MPEVDFEVSLDDTLLEWMRARFTKVGGHVTTFMIQYETTIKGQRLPVVRYDNAHGFAHRDILNRRGQLIDKSRLVNDPSPDIALNIGERDIQENWPRYRRAFLGESG